MLKILIDCNEHPAIFDLPFARTEISDYLCSAGFWDPYTDLRLLENDDPNSVQVKAITETAADLHLLSLFPDDVKLSTINTVCELFYGLPAEQQGELTYQMAMGQITDEKQLLNSIKESMKPRQPIQMNFYCPLTVCMDDPEESDFIETDNRILLGHEDQIRGALMREQMIDGDFDMAQYIADSESLKNKLISAIWDVKTRNREVFGCIHIKLKEPLTEEEQTELTDNITGQNSDGLGEGFEQRPVKTPDGELYISFWNSDDYFLLDDEEFEQHLGGDQQMGGYQ